jgi:hypothetical protein
MVLQLLLDERERLTHRHAVVSPRVGGYVNRRDLNRRDHLEPLAVQVVARAARVGHGYLGVVDRLHLRPTEDGGDGLGPVGPGAIHDDRRQPGQDRLHRLLAREVGNLLAGSTILEGGLFSREHADRTFVGRVRGEPHLTAHRVIAVVERQGRAAVSRQLQHP